MLKLASFGLLGFLVVLMLPANAVVQTPSFLYGAVTLVAHDAYGNEIFSQTVHNQLFDQGEDLILNQAFTDIGGLAVVDNIQIGAICLSAATPLTSELDTNSTFNSAHDLADNATATASTLNCVTDGTVTSSVQVVTLGPLTFTAQDDNTGNWFALDTVTHIGICDADSGDNPVRGCTTTLFAVVNTSDVTLADNETVDVTYTFDISSAGS